ncbi:MAG: I78 family peptidase inhibitor [Roseovarius sp.]
MRLMMFAPLVLALTACMPGEGEEMSNDTGNETVAQTETDADDTCGAAALQGSIGKPVEEQDFGSNYRIVRPGLSVTMEYRADRITVETDENGIVTRVQCG